MTRDPYDLADTRDGHRIARAEDERDHGDQDMPEHYDGTGRI